MKLTVKRGEHGWHVSNGDPLQEWCEPTWERAIEVVRRWLRTGTPIFEGR